jgi:thermostable 8-oxoguanine DNA glycosylase
LPAIASSAPWLADWTRLAPSYELRSERPLATEAGLREELVFCLLGGHGVSYELGRSATDVVMALCPFDPSWSRSELLACAENELRAEKFDPRRVDGKLRRYRFPARKAELLAAAVTWVHGQGGLREPLLRLNLEDERRRWLCDCPGIGPKSASWFLRNAGAAKELAILDVHIIRAMREAGLAGNVRLPRDYEGLERRFRSWCGELGASVAAFDLFLWEWQRGTIPGVVSGG